MPKVSKLITAKLENYFNDTRLEQSFDVSSHKLGKGTDKDFLELQYEYLVEHVAEVENEKRKKYLREYRMKQRARDEKLLNELGKSDKKGELSDEDRGSSSQIEGKGREERRSSEMIENEGSDVPELDLQSQTSNRKLKKRQDTRSVKSTQSKRTTNFDTRSTTTSKTSKGKLRILPELKVPVTSGKIKPKLVDFPRRKMTYSEADRIVHVANNLFRETEKKEIDRIYRYREREHRILPPINESKDKKKAEDESNASDQDDDGNKKKPKVKKRETPMKFRLALHPGTVLKAPKLCQDVEKILEKSERRTLEEQEESSESEAESEYREPVDLEGNFKEPLPKGAGDCTHLSMLLGVVLDESDDTISQRTSSTSIQPTAIIEVDKQIEIEDEHVFPPPESQNSIISGQLKGQKERPEDVQTVEEVNDQEPELDFSQTESAAESESDDEQTKTPKATPESNVPDGKSDNISEKSASQKPVSQNADEKADESEESESDTDTVENEPEPDQNEDDDEKSISVTSKHGSENRPSTPSNSVKDSMSIKVSEQPDEKSQTDETPVGSQVNVNTDEQKAKERDDENESPLPNPSERETPFTEKNEADDETSESADEDDIEARKMGKMSRRERDEKHPSFQRSGGSTTTASSRRSSTEAAVEVIPGNQERSAISISVSPERETPAVDKAEEPLSTEHDAKDQLGVAETNIGEQNDETASPNVMADEESNEMKSQEKEPHQPTQDETQEPSSGRASGLNCPEGELKEGQPRLVPSIQSTQESKDTVEEQAPAQNNGTVLETEELELNADDVKETEELVDTSIGAKDTEESPAEQTFEPESVAKWEDINQISENKESTVAECTQNSVALQMQECDSNERQNDSVSQKSEPEQETLSLGNKEDSTHGALETEEKSSFKLEGIESSHVSENESAEAKNNLPKHLDDFFDNDDAKSAEDPASTDKFINETEILKNQENDIFGNSNEVTTVQADINKLDDGHQSEDIDQRNEELD